MHYNIAFVGDEETTNELGMRELIGIAAGAGIVVLMVLVCSILVCVLVARGINYKCANIYCTEKPTLYC